MDAHGVALAWSTLSWTCMHETAGEACRLVRVLSEVTGTDRGREGTTWGGDVVSAAGAGLFVAAGTKLREVASGVGGD